MLTCALIMSYKIMSVSNTRRQMQLQFGVYCNNRRHELRVVPLNNSAEVQIRGTSQSVQRQGVSSTQQFQALKLAKSLLVLAALEIFLYIVYALIWSAFALLKFLQVPHIVIGTIHSVGLISTDTMVVTSIWNLCIYYFTIPAFRIELHRVLRGCCYCCGSSRQQPAPEQFGQRSASYMNVAQLSRSPISTQHHRAATFSSADCAPPATTGKARNSYVGCVSKVAPNY